MPPLSRTFLLLAFVAVLGAGCSPSLSPLYRDYVVDPVDTPVEARIDAALRAAGWMPQPGEAPNVIATQERTLNHWGLYRIVASLEVVPIGDDYVRLFVHPYRHYVTGARSKIPFLKRGLRGRVLKDLNKAFTEHGLKALATATERDRQAAAQ